MKKKFALLCTSAVVFGVVAGGTAAPTFAAECNDGSSQVKDENGTATGEDTLAASPTGTTVYGDGAESSLNPGYLGVTGDAGYIEISGNADDNPNVQVDGRETEGRLEGRAGFSTDGGADACINGTEIL